MCEAHEEKEMKFEVIASKQDGSPVILKGTEPFVICLDREPDGITEQIIPKIKRKKRKKGFDRGITLIKGFKPID